MSGALYLGKCFASAQDAAHFAWSGVAPVIGTGSPPTVTTVEKTTDWQIITRQNGSVIATVDAPGLHFATCSPSQHVLEGVQLGWLVAGVWLAAWAVVVIRKALIR